VGGLARLTPQASLWRNQDFVRLWLGASISAIGNHVTALAMPLIAVLMFAAGPGDTGALTAASFAPLLLFGLPAGAWVDRLRRRPVRIVADLGSALVIACVPVAAIAGVLRLEHLYIVAFLAGTLNVFTRLTVSALLPSLVGPSDLLAANSAMLTSFSVALIAGPTLAGLLVQLMPAPVVLLLDATTFVISAVCFVVLREPAVPPRERTDSSLLAEIGEGLQWLRANPILFRLTVSIGLANLAWFGVMGVIVPFGTTDLALSPAVLGIALGVAGPAGLVGALVAARSARRFGIGPTLVASLTGELLSRVILVAAGGPTVVAAVIVGASQAVFGFIAPLWDVNSSSLRQLVTPHRLLGRVGAASNFVGNGTAPIGALLAGWIGEAAGPRTALVVATAITLVSLICLVTSPAPRLRTPEALS
jgi:MFS family permease